MGIADYIVSLGYPSDIHVVRTIQQGLPGNRGNALTHEDKLLIQYMFLMMFDE